MPDQPAPPKAVWEADTTHPDKASQIRDALRQVLDPELGLSVIDLGLVRQVSIADGEIHLKMVLTTPFCPYGPALLEMARSKTEQACGLAVQVELLPEMWNPSMMEEGAAASWGFF